MVNHMLRPDFDFTGVEFVTYINSQMPDLPCIILTAFTDNSIAEDLVIKNMIQERNALSNDLAPFSEDLKQAVRVFNNRLGRHEIEFGIC